MGLEFLDVTTQVNIARISSSRSHGGRREDVYRITNNSSSTVDTHLLFIARGLSFDIEMENASGQTENGDPYLRVFLADGVLPPGESIVQKLTFKRHSNAPPVRYTLQILSGQGNP